MIARRLLPLLTILALNACASATGPETDDWRTVVGTIDIGSDFHDVLKVPAQARVGEEFRVTVTTFGSSSCTRPAATAVKTQPLRAELIPHDEVAPEGSICTADLRAFPREVPLRFDQAGEAVIVLRGRPQDSRVERRVTIVP